MMKHRQKEPRKSVNKASPVKENKDPWFHKPVWWLVIITCLLYSRTMNLGFTRLDDSIFIIENEQYNKGFDNITTSFHRGLFNPTADVYYRPVFLVDFILESKIFGNKPAGYHFTNLLFHLLSVILLYTFLRRLRLSDINAFLLSMIFAVHPVLSQAVAWIPGRNDMLLMIFFMSGMIVTIDYGKKPGPVLYFVQLLLFLLALFTKETAVIIPVIMITILIFCFSVSWKKILPLAAGWVVAILAWSLVRASATLSPGDGLFSDMMHSALGRLQAIIQYLGKIFFPFNLTVFPVINEITLVWGVIATILLISLVVYSKSYDKPLTWIGLFWFLVFLLPVLIVPKSLNDQVFEHRLYLPLAGILLMMGPVIQLTDHWPGTQRYLFFGAIAMVFASISFVRTAYYDSPLTFWTKAVEGSPHSCYARMMLGTKVDSPAEREKLFLEAWKLDPDQKNLNYYLGKVMVEKKAYDSAAYFLRRESRKTQVPDVFFMLAQLSYMKQQYDTTAQYLEKVVQMDPLNPQANSNLLMVYLQLGQKDKAKNLVELMRQKGIQVPANLETMVAKTKPD